jgi:hypothetical protein
MILFVVDHLEIMAPHKWSELIMEYFVDECFKMVQDGKTPANTDAFLGHLITPWPSNPLIEPSAQRI